MNKGSARAVTFPMPKPGVHVQRRGDHHFTCNTRCRSCWDGRAPWLRRDNSVLCAGRSTACPCSSLGQQCCSSHLQGHCSSQPSEGAEQVSTDTARKPRAGVSSRGGDIQTTSHSHRHIHQAPLGQRTMEWFGLERTLKSIYSSKPSTMDKDLSSMVLLQDMV